MAYDKDTQRNSNTPPRTYGQEAWLEVVGDGSCRGSFPMAPWLDFVATAGEDDRSLVVVAVDTLRNSTLTQLSFPIEEVVNDREYFASGNGAWVLRRQHNARYPWVLKRASGGPASSALIPS